MNGGRDCGENHGSVTTNERVQQQQHRYVAIGYAERSKDVCLVGCTRALAGDGVQKSEMPPVSGSSATAMSAAVTTSGALNRTGLKPECVLVVAVKLIVRVVSRPPADTTQTKTNEFNDTLPKEWLASGMLLTPNRLEILGLHSLEHRRVFCDLVLCYKIMNGILDTEIAHVLTVADNSKTRSHSMKLTKYHCSIDATKYYFF